jgi:hypothetical protein
MERGNFSLRVMNVTWIDLDPLSFILHFLNQFWIAARLVCSFREAMAGSLSVDSFAVSSEKFARVDSGEVVRSANSKGSLLLWPVLRCFLSHHLS